MPDSLWEEGKKVVNPYNFIPFGSECKRKKERKDESFTGKIICELIPKTDLFIPNTSNDNTFNTYKSSEDEKDRHKSYDFFSYTDLSSLSYEKKNAQSIKEPIAPKPVIPGSSIRGMIKNEYEALTDSCFTTNYNLDLVRRQIQPREAALLVGAICDDGSKEWRLYPAKKISLPDHLARGFKTGMIVTYESENKKNATKVNKSNIKPSEFFKVFHENKNNKEYLGVVLIGQGLGGNNKGHTHIFSQTSNHFLAGKSIENAVEKLKIIMDSYRKNDETSYIGYDIPDIPTENTMIPVWYYKRMDTQEFYYFSPAALGKDYFYNTMEDIVRNHTGSNEKEDSVNNSFLPCENPEELCDACNLFGIVFDKAKNNSSVASKIRFTDALLVDQESLLEDLYRKPQVINILASPHPCCVEMYTYLNSRNPNKEKYWDFEWADLSDNYIGDRIRFNGRKSYWHHTNYLNDTVDVTKNMNMKLKIRQLKGFPDNNGDKVKFQFEVYFEKISELDLKRLLWILSLGDNENTRYHKIGMGKPFGLGSNKIKVCDVLLRKLKREGGRIIYHPCVSEKENYHIYFNNAENKEIENQILEELFNRGEKIKEGIHRSVYDSFLKMMTFESTKDVQVTYPTATNQYGETTIYNWFKANKDGKVFKKTLPKAKNKEVTLPTFKEVLINGGKGPRNYK